MSDKKWYDGIEERVVAAYKEKGLRAVQGRFSDFAGGCGVCALGALHRDICNVPGFKISALADRLGTTPEEVWAFVDGFDFNATNDYSSLLALEHPDIYQAGIRSWEAVKAAGLVAE